MSQTTLAASAPEPPAAGLPDAVIDARARAHGRCRLDPPTAEYAPWLPVTVPDFVGLLDTETLAEFVDAGGDTRPCRNTDPEDYFPIVGPKVPEIGGQRYIEEQERARALCGGCPVRVECLELALRTRGGRHGVWGGASEWERINIRAARLAEIRAAKAAA